MSVEYISLLILVFIVGLLIGLAYYIVITVREDRGASRVREEQLILMLENVESIALDVGKAQSDVSDFQNSLNNKLNALTSFIDERNSYVTFQQEQFNALAKSDMLAARREELLRTKELKVALERLMGVALTSRQPASSNDILAIENLTRRIEELEQILKDN
jgi:hypothetical protein